MRRNSRLGQVSKQLHRIVLPNAVVLQSSFRISLLLRGAVQQSEAIKLEVSDAGGCTARGQSVTVVDEFLYSIFVSLLWWRWNWKRACEHSLGRAERVLYLLRQSGFQHQRAAIAHQLKYASSVVGSHIDYVSALAGIDGYETEIAAFAKLSADLLRVVSCTPPSTSGPALQALFGVWDPRSRICILRLCFFVSSRVCRSRQRMRA